MPAPPYAHSPYACHRPVRVRRVGEGVTGFVPGDRVLIHAAAGGVGHVAVQLAKELGAYVIGTARAANHDFLRELGADELIDYTTTDFRTTVTPVDGLLIGASIDAGTDTQQATARGLRYVWVTAETSGKVLTQITERIETGRLQVKVQHTYPLTEAAAAHRTIEEKRTNGKIVLVP